MIPIDEFIKGFSNEFDGIGKLQPWEITNNLSDIICKKIETLDGNFIIKDGIAVHKSARIEERVILKGPLIISEDCFIGANAYLRNGVFLGKGTSVGPACEVKTSIIFEHTEIA